jgi:outer membrane protein OmpA-like peptidoglycan-associated protein
MMKTVITSHARFIQYLVSVVLVVALAGCNVAPTTPATPPTAAPAPSSPPAPAPQVQAIPFQDAVVKAANDLFSKAQLSLQGAGGSTKQMLVIDPLIDGLSGAQSNATESVESRIIELVNAKYMQFDVQPFLTSNVNKSPLVLIGSFTGVNKEGKTVGRREAFRIWLTLLDIKSGKIISKAKEFAQVGGVDITPTAYFEDSSAWVPDPATEAYLKTCQHSTKPGDPINPAYLDRIMAAALISEAINAYDNGRYQESLDLYRSALQTPGGDQFRVYNGIYLTNLKLGRQDEATQALGKVVDYGLANKRLAVKFLFRPGSTDFLPSPTLTEPYDIWLKQIAQRTSQSSACLEVVGHTSRTGPEPLNERLSLLRALYIKQRLEYEMSALSSRVIANGVGSKENLVGTGTDDARDALDRRVEFKVIEQCINSQI